jgi:uncharacterized protein with HEPN domain
MNYAYNKIHPSLPFNSEKISSLTDDEIEHIDQFIFRFSKLQDAIGNKLFKAVLASLDEEIINKPALDIFNRLEQLEIIENYEKWKELRDLRNELAHDYEEDTSETAQKLNILFDKKQQLEKYLNDIIKYLSDKSLV